MDKNRRQLIQFLGTLPLLNGFATSGHSSEIDTWELDISRFDEILLPREHGQRVLRNSPPIFRRYPSRDHCMQMAAFFRKNEGLLVIANDPIAAMVDWEIRPGSKLRIHFYGKKPQVMTFSIAPTLEAAASRYRQWASGQFWMKNRTRKSPRLNFIAVASSSSVAVESAYLERLQKAIVKPVGVWFTQWRRYPFDRNYPDYVAKETVAFAGLLKSLRDQGVIAMPYVNAQLWDSGLVSFRQTADAVAIRSNQGAFHSYSADLQSLRYGCPAAKGWRDVIVSARGNIRDSSGQPSNGIYLDMLAAAEPQLCWAGDHGHVPGDPTVWVEGQRALLKQIGGAIMVEGCAEVYLDLCDYALMHLWSAASDTVPLWHAVYGDSVQSVGWRLPTGISQAGFEKIRARAREFGVDALASPWMSEEPERRIFGRLLPEDAPPAAPLLRGFQ